MRTKRALDADDEIDHMLRHAPFLSGRSVYPEDGIVACGAQLEHLDDSWAPFLACFLEWRHASVPRIVREFSNGLWEDASIDSMFDSKFLKDERVQIELRRMPPVY